MKNPFNLFKKKIYRLHKSESGLWMVKKKFCILYMGPKEKCELYLSRLESA